MNKKNPIDFCHGFGHQDSDKLMKTLSCCYLHFAGDSIKGLRSPILDIHREQKLLDWTRTVEKYLKGSLLDDMSAVDAVNADAV